MFLYVAGIHLMPSFAKPGASLYFNGSLYDKMADDVHLTGNAE
jgi:hypothetical protein